MKRYLARIMALAMTLCLFGAAAKAVGIEDFSPVQAERYRVIVPEGLALNEKRNKGSLEVSLNRSKTDWNTALSTGFDFSSGTLSFQVEVAPPEDDADWRCCGITGSGDLDEMISIFEEEWEPEDGPYCNGFDLGTYEKRNRLFVPYNTAEYEPEYMLLKWINGEKNVRWEYLRVDVTSRTQPLRADISMVEAGRIIPDTGVGISSATDVGQVDYTLRPFSEEYKRIVTRIKAPRGASAWKNANIYEDGTPESIENGEIRITCRLNRNCSVAQTHNIQWLDAAGKTIMYETIYITAAEDDVQPVPVYSSGEYGWQPVDSERLTIKNECPALISTPYRTQTGEIHLTQNGRISEALPKSAQIYFSVMPPAGASYVRFNQFGGDRIYGLDKDGMEMQDEYTREYGDVIKASEGKPLQVMTLPAFSRNSMTERNGAELSWIKSSGMPGRFSGDVVMLYWYRDDPTVPNSAGQMPEPIKKEYFCVTSEPFVQTFRGKVYHDAPDGITVIKVPILVINEGTKAELSLVIKVYPQYGFNAQHYELSLEDSHGVLYELQNDAELYLPYPENGSMEDDRVYTLRHYVEDGDEEYIYEKLEKTPIGLRAQVSSFSPFVLSWKDGAAPKVEDLPATGDTSRTGLYLALLAGACFLLAAMRRSAHKRA